MCGISSISSSRVKWDHSHASFLLGLAKFWGGVREGSGERLDLVEQADNEGRKGVGVLLAVGGEVFWY